MIKSLLKDKTGIVQLLPLLALYCVLVAVFSSNTLVGDEARHLDYAMNLTNGFYTNSENPEFRNGPGYPLVMTILTAWDAPYIFYKFFNALLIFFGTVLFFKALLIYFSPGKALLLSYIFGSYPPLLRWMTYIYSESLAIFLACGFLYFYLKAISRSDQKRLNIVFAAFFLGFLTLTKVIFGYVLVTVGLFYLIYYLIRRKTKAKVSILILIGAFILCIPYLACTYNLTGKTLYWGSGGGEILYWRSSPFENEYGDWISRDVVLGIKQNEHFDNATPYQNHGTFLKSLEPYDYVLRDELYKEKAIENMKSAPLKYAQNTLASGIRLFFNYPYSYTAQSPSSLVYIIPNGLLLLLLLSALFLAFKRAASIPFEIRFIGLMGLITIGGLTLGNGMIRYLLPIIPFLFLFIFVVLNRLVKIQLLNSAQE